MPRKKKSHIPAEAASAEEVEYLGNARDATTGLGTEESTKATYRSACRCVAKWIAANHPKAEIEEYISGIGTNAITITQPLPVKMVVGFFEGVTKHGFDLSKEKETVAEVIEEEGEEVEGEEEEEEGTSRKKRKREKGPLSHSTVMGYRSGLLYFYDANKWKWISDTADEFIVDLLYKYEKAICSCKRLGRMKVQEGKSPLPLTGLQLLAEKMCKMTPSKHKNNINEKY